MRPRGLLGVRADAPVIGQILRFCAVGGANAALAFVTYVLFVTAGVPVFGATLLSGALATINGYVWNQRWTFAAADLWRARAAYVTVQAAGVTAGSTAVWLLVTVAGVPRIPAYLVTVVPVTVATFTANRYWTFGGRWDAHPATDPGTRTVRS